MAPDINPRASRITDARPEEGSTTRPVLCRQYLSAVFGSRLEYHDGASDAVSPSAFRTEAS